MAEKRFEVELTQGAEQDLEAIIDYVAEHSSAAIAEDLLEAFLGKVETLERFPSRGSLPHELSALGIKEYRQLLLTPYRLIYRVTEGKVIIIIVADGRRDMQALLERRLLGR